MLFGDDDKSSKCESYVELQLVRVCVKKNEVEAETLQHQPMPLDII